MNLICLNIALNEHSICYIWISVGIQLIFYHTYINLYVLFDDST